jgi:glycosyltransferase involved in cell wall biosynthesis
MKKKIIVFANHVAFFISHRLNIFIEAKKRGYEFLLITGKKSSGIMEKKSLNKIKKYKIQHKTINFNSYSFNILNDLMSIIKILIIIKKFKPDILHTVAPKPNLYGGIIAKFLNLKFTVVSFSGMGFLFTGNLSIVNYIKKFFFEALLHYVYLNKKIYTIVQNKDDLNFLRKKYDLKKNIQLIKGGSGVNLKKLTKIKRNKTKNIVFSARLVKSKGIVEFIKAAIKLKKTYPEWNFHIYGASDYKSNDNFYLNNFKDEIKKRIIEYKGYTTNLNSILKNSEIFCLPSYREGMPKSILEATAVGIPCVVSNAVGIKESIINNKTGLLFKNKDYKDLARKISYLIDNPKKRREFSKRGKLFVKEFASIKNVTKKIFHIYELQK